MPRSNRVVDNHSWSQVADFRNYYLHTVVTHIDANGVSWAAQVQDILQNDNGVIQAQIYKLSREPEGGWMDRVWVNWDTLNLIMPRLGMVTINGQWYFLQRQPARRMRKGYGNETIFLSALEGSYIDDEANPMHADAIRQIWYGCEGRVTHNIVQVQKCLYYTTEMVAEFNEHGQAVLIPGKEKMGEMVCKALLVNNSELQVLRPAVSTPH